MENKVIRYETQIQLVPSSVKKLNSQFALVDILLCYHGRNRNMTAMSKEVIEAALPSLYGIPIVGEYIYLDDGSQDFGSHGGKIIISDKGIKFEDTTKPYGFITKDAVDNAKWITITEKNAIDKHEYLELKGCIVWQKRYEEVSALLDKNYGQSMEIEIVSTEGYDSDGYLNIKKMVFSAACILGSNPDGTDVIPCFESACIGRHYELDSFKQEFSLMLDEYKNFNEPDGTTATVQNNATNNNPHMEGENKMDLTKFTALLSEIKCEGNAYIKYDLLSADETKIYVFDKEDGYRIYSVEYVMSNDDPVINWNTKTEGDITFTEKSEEVSRLTAIYNEINDVLSKKYEKDYKEKLDEKIKEVSAGIEEKYTTLQDEYQTLRNSYSVIKEKLDKFEAIEAEKAKQSHIKAVKETLERFEKKIGKAPEFIYFKAKLENYEDVDLEKLDKDLTMLSGDVLINSNTKKTFSYNPTSTNVNKYSTENELTNRYGHLFDGFVD